MYKILKQQQENSLISKSLNQEQKVDKTRKKVRQNEIIITSKVAKNQQHTKQVKEEDDVLCNEIPINDFTLSKIMPQGDKISILELKEIIIFDFRFFSEPGNKHFPEKKQNCVKCKVCRWEVANDIKLKIHKTKYRCMGCFIKYQRNVNLCITPCFEEFHLHPGRYFKRNMSQKAQKTDKIQYQTDHIKKKDTKQLV